MADNNQQEGILVEGEMELKVEPTAECYTEEEQNENGFPGFDNTNATPSTANTGALNLWTSKATHCLINQYKKYRSLVGQTTQIRSLREMFEMISLEMQNYGFYFSPQKCENKWRVLERKYKNLVFRERAKKPGRMRHYGHWEHKRALDEIFNEKRKHMYIEESDFSAPPSSAKLTATTLPRTRNEQDNCNSDQQPEEQDLSFVSDGNFSASKSNDDASAHGGSLTALFERFLEEMERNFALAERNKEKRHKEKMSIWQSQLEVQRKILKLKEQKMELRKSQMMAAAQHFDLNF